MHQTNDVTPDGKDVAVVVIGRNEGARLIACLDALQGAAERIIYVDSGSTDGSQDAASARQAQVLALDMAQPFTAARARNAGLAKLANDRGQVGFVQFVDGDSALHPDWIDIGRAFLIAHPDVAVVAGRLREKYPDASVYNRLCDAEWDTPIGAVRACGGIAMMRLAPVLDAGGFDADLIAGEEPELCLRLRKSDWKIWRLDAEMALHDAAMTRFRHWWRRAKRGGYAFAEGAAMHGAAPERHCVAPLRLVIFWGLVMPVVTVLGAIVTPWALLLLLAWPVQMMRLRKRGMGWQRAFFLTLTRLPEGQGALTYWLRRMTHRQAQLIEYK